jgi:hypothetical protein
MSLGSRVFARLLGYAKDLAAADQRAFHDADRPSRLELREVAI